ncbi:beta-lactamase family protein [Planomonospora sp. ID91781]|uniref:serine hydrolase domain-containing protein n=1 Tax=Planomonospora sp. ID91781 TaxID=2738135 RepID=UPI0018C37D0F|nr:serine hydrolase domain-containing protein [Planomonospora sp. ID91781]MBG0821065.1 beta-lactamase family protein [Planomonospora sp. ID91781]
MATFSRRNLIRTGAALAPALLTARPAAAAPPPTGLQTTGTAPAELAGFDEVMKTFVKEREISCAQLAISKRGRLLLARGYYTASQARYVPPVSPTSLFRIASLSKPVTAAAVMRLVQEGRLGLSAPVTTLLGLSAEADPRLAQVTVLRLMQHLGGWDRSVSLDHLWSDHAISAALDVPLPIDHADIIRYATARPLDFAPGTGMAYSNYGYMLLGRIIEKVSGTDYESYVKEKVLAPLGITRMRIGRSLRSEAAAGEVAYASQYTAKTVLDDTGTTVPYPYGGFNVPNHDANGGWLASAVDLVRFAGVFDAAGPVLGAASIAKVLAKPEIGVSGDGWWYGCGWYVRQVPGNLNTWHAGSMPGTYTYLARLQNGFTYAALFNRREEQGTPDYDVLSSRMNAALNKVASWPATDLGPRYF